jgi:hypothetical protein
MAAIGSPSLNNLDRDFGDRTLVVYGINLTTIEKGLGDWERNSMLISAI